MDANHPLRIFFKNVPGTVRVSRYLKNKKCNQVHYISTKHLDKFPQLSPKNEHVFFQPVSRKARHGRKESSYATRVLWVDIDHNVLPTTFLYHPSCIVKSGHGYHLYWLLDEAVSITHKESSEQIFEQALKQLASLFNGDISTTHIAACMRMPGSLNIKNEASIKVEWENFDYTYPTSLIPKLANEYQNSVVPIKKEPTQKKPVRNHQHQIDSFDILNECSAISFAASSPDSISEVEWFNVLRTVSKVPDGDSLCHEISRFYSNYSYEETSKKINHAQRYNPATCESLSCIGQCGGCAWKNKVRSPAGIPYKKMAKHNAKEYRRTSA